MAVSDQQLESPHATLYSQQGPGGGGEQVDGTLEPSLLTPTKGMVRWILPHRRRLPALQTRARASTRSLLRYSWHRGRYGLDRADLCLHKAGREDPRGYPLRSPHTKSRLPSTEGNSLTGKHRGFTHWLPALQTSFPSTSFRSAGKNLASDACTATSTPPWPRPAMSPSPEASGAAPTVGRTLPFTSSSRARFFTSLSSDHFIRSGLEADVSAGGGHRHPTRVRSPRAAHACAPGLDWASDRSSVTLGWASHPQAERDPRDKRQARSGGAAIHAAASPRAKRCLHQGSLRERATRRARSFLLRRQSPHRRGALRPRDNGLRGRRVSLRLVPSDQTTHPTGHLPKASWYRALADASHTPSCGARPPLRRRGPTTSEHAERDHLHRLRVMHACPHPAKRPPTRASSPAA